MRTLFPTGCVLRERERERGGRDAVALVADIGGTHTRCAIADDAGRFDGVRKFVNADFATPEALFRRYLDSTGASPREARIAIAAPVEGDPVRLTNRDWTFGAAALLDALEVARVSIINDFAAIACALPALSPSQYVALGGAPPNARRAQVALGAGTGFGMSVRLPVDGDSEVIVPTEFGHVTFSAGDAFEDGLAAFARAEHGGHCSVERILSGPGLALIHDYLHHAQGDARPRAAPADVVALAERGDASALEAVRHFFAMLAGACGNAALAITALGGVFVAGGMATRLQSLLDVDAFRTRFEAKGRFGALLSRCPLLLITEAEPALVGLARLTHSSFHPEAAI